MKFNKKILLYILIIGVLLSGCDSDELNEFELTTIRDNLRLLFEKTPEYPYDYLPQYEKSDIISYAYDSKTHTIYTTSASTDSYENIAGFFSTVMQGRNNIDYKTEYYFDNEYYAYGMIGNFTFLIEVKAADDNIKGGYTQTITTNIHYLLEDELKLENDFRELKGTNAQIYINPCIKISQKIHDTNGIYFSFPLHKMELIDETYGVELYINDILYSSRKSSDTIRVDTNDISGSNRIKMIAYDENNCVRGISVIDKLYLLNAIDSVEISSITGQYNDISTLYIYNTEMLNDISSILSLPNLNELYIIGNSNIEDYSCILQAENIQLLVLDGIDNPIISSLSVLNNLGTLILKNSTYNADIEEILQNTSINNLEIIDCDNIDISTTLSNVNNIERLRLSSNNTIKLIQIKNPQASIRIIEINDCASLQDIIGMDNIINFNMLKVSDCTSFLPSYPFDNLFNLGYVFINNCPSIDSESTVCKTLFSNNSIFGFEITNGFNEFNTHYNRKDTSQEELQ